MAQECEWKEEQDFQWNDLFQEHLDNIEKKTFPIIHGEVSLQAEWSYGDLPMYHEEDCIYNVV